MPEAERDTSHFSSKALSSELLRHLRGSHSQQAFSKALGFGSNVAYSWESGRRFPEVSVFFRAALLAQVPLRERLMAFLKDPPGELSEARLTSPRTTKLLVQFLVGTAPKRSLALSLGVDRTTLARWTAGNSEPRVPEFLRLVEFTTQRWMEFVELFADPDTLSSTQAAYHDLRVQQRLAYERPWSHALLRALELDSYKSAPVHSSQLLSDAIGITEVEVEHLLGELKEADQITWTGTHWKLQRVLTVDTRQEPERNRQLKLHWAQAATARLAEGEFGEDSLFSFNLFAISEERFRRLRELHLEYFDQVRALIEGSESADRVVLMNLQLLPLEKPEG